MTGPAAIPAYPVAVVALVFWIVVLGAVFRWSWHTLTRRVRRPR